MKYPGVLRVFATVILILSIISGFFALLAFASSEFRTFRFFDVTFLFSIASFSIFGIISSILWFFGIRKISYAVLSLNIAGISIVLLYSIYSAIKDITKYSVIYYVIIFFFAVLLSFFIGSLFYRPVSSLRKESSRISLLTGFGLFSMVYLIPLLSVYYLQYVSKKQYEIYVSNVISNGHLERYNALNMIDENLETWWTPLNRTGDGASFKMYTSEDTIIAFDIHPGSHYQNYPNYGNLFPLNSRLLEAEVEFSDNTTQTIRLKDEDRVQRIFINPTKAKKFRVRIVKTVRGSRWNDLCISHFRPIGEGNYFRN